VKKRSASSAVLAIVAVFALTGTALAGTFQNGGFEAGPAGNSAD
jgi:hypothetical protein